MRYRPLLPLGAGPCAKQTVQATVVTPEGDTYEGTNYCETPQARCPREGMPTGQGYELCRAVCHQPAHAEQNALALAGDRAHGSILKVEGHTYACEACKAAALKAGVAGLVVAGVVEPLSVHTEHPHTEWVGGSYPAHHPV